MRTSIIAAMGTNWVIGNKGKLPWGRGLPADLKRFRDLTKGHTILMGRNTAASLEWKPLKDRLNIVVTKILGRKDVPPGFVRMPSIESGIELAATSAKETELFIIGGSQIFAAAEPLVERMYLTMINSEFEGDAKFPIDFNDKEVWEPVLTENRQPDEKNQYEMCFTVWDRKK